MDLSMIIIKELTEEFEESFTCLGEITEKIITFTVITEKAVKIIYKNGKKITKTISYRLQFTHGAKFMASSISNFINDFDDGSQT